MNRAVKVLVLRIAQIIEEYSEREIEEAVAILAEYESGSKLLQHLSSRSSSNEPKDGYRLGSAKRATKAVAATTSRAVLKAKESHPDKYELLSGFDKLVRTGQILQSNESLRRFGEQLSKDFEPRKSRRESISAVMDVLAEHSLEEIRSHIEAVLEYAERTSGDGYQELANFLIKGRLEE